MKPIYLEPDEEITSVIEKISSLSDRKIALVGPKNSSLFQSLINLKLLAKEAKKLDKELVIIGSNKTGLRLAEQVGLAAFASLGAVSDAPTPAPKKAAAAEPTTDAEELVDGVKVNRYQPPVGGAVAAESADAVEETADPEVAEEVSEGEEAEPTEEPMPFTPIAIGGAEAVPAEATVNVETDTGEPAPISDKEAASEELPAIVGRDYSTRTEFVIPWRSVIAAGGLLLIAFVLMIIFLPKAKVTVNFPAKPVDQTLTLTATTATDSTETAVPATVITSRQEISKTITATGKKDIGAKATGNVTIKNCEDTSSHSLAAGSKLTASNKTFVTNSAITIPAGQFSNGGQSCNSTTVSAAITANEAGETYNLTSVSFTITGLSSRFTTTGTTSGGSSKQVTVLNQSDVDKVLAEVKLQATDAATAELKTKAEQQTILDGSTWQTVVTQAVDKKVGDQVDSANLSYIAELSALAFDSNSAQEKIRSTISKDIDEGEELVIPEGKTPVLTFKALSDDKLSQTFDAAVSGFIVTKINKTDIAGAIARKSKKSAEAILADRFKATSSDIAVTPSWWFGRLPLLPQAISVEYGFIQAEEVTE